jgi:hypothetical protein
MMHAIYIHAIDVLIRKNARFLTVAAPHLQSTGPVERRRRAANVSER